MSNNGGSVRPDSIFGPDAIRELHQRVKAAVQTVDPAPWFDVSPVSIEMFSEGDEPAFVHRKKMEERTARFMLRALFAGELRAHFSDGLSSFDVPGWAWEGAGHITDIWFFGQLALDIRLPEKWQRWSCHRFYLDQHEFAEWLDRQSLADSEGLAELPEPYDAHLRPMLVNKRLPPDIRATASICAWSAKVAGTRRCSIAWR